MGPQINKTDDASILCADGTCLKERYNEIVGKLTPFQRLVPGDPSSARVQDEPRLV